jgi:transcriptional regulator with PAS, ATPase and Fis domain
MLKLNCAALPSELVESELFGYERGAFTGAFQKKPGMFELADGGTILLDEIGDMDFRLQAKLLQVLQDSEFQRLGGKDTIRVDVRVIAATHRDLEKRIADDLFREDLYYRLNVVSLSVPPLRERKDDIIALADFFIRKHAEPDTANAKIPPRLQELFLEYQWPGNVRELERVIERGVALADSDQLQLDDLPASLLDGYAEVLVPSFRRFESLRTWGSRYARMVFERCDNNKRRTCRELGISYHTLQGYLRAGQRQIVDADERLRPHASPGGNSREAGASARSEVGKGTGAPPRAAKNAGLPPANATGVGTADAPRGSSPGGSGEVRW